jgi:hypothetical protein
MCIVIGAACKLEFVNGSYREHTEASRLLQLLWTYPTVNHALRKLWQCYYILEMIVRFKLLFYASVRSLTMDRQGQKHGGVDVLGHCAFVGLHCNSWIIMHGMEHVKLVNNTFQLVVFDRSLLFWNVTQCCLVVTCTSKHCFLSQKSEDLMYAAAEAWNQSVSLSVSSSVHVILG